MLWITAQHGPAMISADGQPPDSGPGRHDGGGIRRGTPRSRGDGGGSRDGGDGGAVKGAGGCGKIGSGVDDRGHSG